jgi:SPP1 family predicted phage head-tail adaptor
VDAGLLDRQITLSHRTLTLNSQGERVPTWTEYATVRAQKIDVSGREYFSAGAMLAQAVFRFRIRFRDDVVETDQVDYDGTKYNINSISELGRRDGLELYCTGLL